MKLWLQTTWTVAKWEFQRYFKLKDQIIGFVSLLIGAGVGMGAVRLSQSASKVELAVIGASSAFALPEKGHIKLASGEHTEQEWRSLVEDRKIDGLLLVSASNEVPWHAELIVRHEPTWLAELRPVLQNERMLWQMQAASIAPTKLAQILAPADIEVVTLADRDVSKLDRLVAFSILGAVLITSWIGLAYMMTGITGEKQQRVTEQIVSAIRPQMWIDGKVLGITGAAIGSLAFLFGTALVCLPAAWLLGYEFALPGSLKRWDYIPLFAVFYFGGVFFWNCFYAGVASVINDPNTSSRTSLLFLPMLPMFATGLVVSQPDGPIMRILSLVPGASSTAMPMRLVLGEVSFVEVLASVVLMVAGIAALRLLAGRVFAAGIMLYGKEPTWIDIATWTLGRQGRASMAPIARSLLAAICLSSCISGGLLNTAAAQDTFDSSVQLRSFDEVWQTIKDVHWNRKLVGEEWDAVRDELRPKVERAENVTVVREIMQTMISKLGHSHCGIIPSETYQAMEEQSQQGGEGISGLTLRFIEDQLVVTQVRPGSPAATAGIEVGWALQSISRPSSPNKAATNEAKTLTAEQLIQRVRAATEHQVTRFETAIGLAATSVVTGSIGEQLILAFEDHEGTRQNVEIQLTKGNGKPTKLGHLPVTNVEFRSEKLPPNIGLVTFNAFLDPPRLIKEFQYAVTQENANSKGLVIDLRGNMGGMVVLTMGMCGWLVDEPTKLGLMTMKDTPLNLVINPRKPKFKRPIAILIDECSISAAEIFAGGLQDIGVARVFGNRSAGLVLPSNVTSLPNKDGFQYVTANYESRSGRVLEGRGVEPDESISLTRARLQAEQDPVLAAAMHWILSKS